ncbi:hypothetical protein [uncultured Pontibacter sp.]|uniref:hypothetical protein n=1 Tax=uncultured Pontibacter sp. TaxID=453356 RepID=UPI00262FCCEB|nr:hypothetical protein [uncultured Pontibacter sp.]
MRNKLFILGAILCLFISTVDEVMAQRFQPNRKKSSSYRYFKRSEKFSIMGGVGLTVMNSDNRTNGFSDGLGNMLQQNGVGPTLGFGAMYQVSPYVALRGNLNYAGFNSDLYQRQNLDLLFSANVAEVSGSVVVNLLDSYLPSRGPYSSGLLRLVVPYVKGGVGLLYYSASSSTASDNSGFAAVIPVGGGLRINYSSRVSFAPELTLNYTTTDYLDNLQKSGGLTGGNDAYLSASVNMMYTISTKRRYSFRRGK